MQYLCGNNNDLLVGNGPPAMVPSTLKEEKSKKQLERKKEEKEKEKERRTSRSLHQGLSTRGNPPCDFMGIVVDIS